MSRRAKVAVPAPLKDIEEHVEGFRQYVKRIVVS